METETNFNAVLEAADTLSLDEQETLLDILSHRVADSNRQRLVEEVQAARREFAQGQCTVVTADDLMQELLS
jgi:hypothetical protein